MTTHQQEKTITPRQKRIQLIRELEKLRGSKIITYLTCTRSGLDTQMALDVVRYIYDHLQAIKKSSPEVKPKIDLFLHSNGGDGTVPWRLVTLIREFTDDFGVIVPHRAFSAATLTALGANEIVMHPMGMLGPTDPSVINQYNPTDSKGQPIPISVEDVTAYIQLIKEDAGIEHEDELVQAIKILAEKVHPLALGNVKRSISQSRMMASKLLNLHMQNKQEHKVQEIADNLTSKLFYHGHPINRLEAREQIGLETVQSTVAPEIELAIWNLYLEYENTMDLLTPFAAPEDFITDLQSTQVGSVKSSAVIAAKLVYIESIHDCDISSLKYQFAGQKLPNNTVSCSPIAWPVRWTKETS